MDSNSTQCLLFMGDEKKCQVILVLKRVTAALSLLGCLFMILVVWLFRKYNVLSQRLIVYLSVAAAFNAACYLMGGRTRDGVPCDFEAFLLSYFDWSVLMWVVCITFNLYQNVVIQRRTEAYEKFYHFFGWLFPPLFCSLVPLIGDNYGPAGAWCWIRHSSVVLRFMMWYVPLWTLIVALFAAYGYIYYVVRKRASAWQGSYDAETERSRARIREDVNQLKAYPFVYLLLSFFPFVLRIHNAATAEGTDVFALWILTVLSAPLQGAVNAVVFGLDPETRGRLTCSKMCLAFTNRFRGAVVQEYPPTPTGSSLAPMAPPDSARPIVASIVSRDDETTSSVPVPGTGKPPQTHKNSFMNRYSSL